MSRLRVGDRNSNTLINGLVFYVVLRVLYLCFVLIGFQHFVFCRLCLSFGSVFMSINQVLIDKSFFLSIDFLNQFIIRSELGTNIRLTAL
jgi:hypothetical protein